MRKMKTRTRFKEKPSVEEIYKIDDQVLHMLNMPNPCPVCVEIVEHTVTLYVGPRDWAWDRKTGELIGSGTTIRP